MGSPTDQGDVVEPAVVPENMDELAMLALIANHQGDNGQNQQH